MDIQRVTPARLRRRVDPSSLGFRTTAEVTPVRGALNQERAMEALSFGVGIETKGYNLVVTGFSGSGRTAMVRAFLEQVAATRPTPEDWLYVHNFDQPDKPVALSLPSGKGRELAADMERFIVQARQQISRAFETERYAERRQQVASQLAQRRDAILKELDAFARERSYGLEMNPNGIVAIPLLDGKPMRSEDVEKLALAERQALERKGLEVQTEVGMIMRKLGQLEREGTDLLNGVDREIAGFAIEPLMQGLRERYAAHAAVIAHLERIAQDIPNHLSDFRPGAPDRAAEPASPLEAAFAVDHTDRYRVNVIVDNGSQHGAPVAVEPNPTYYNLMGRVEYRATFGMALTDFRQIKGGALHRANGGFLILDAEDLLAGNPFAWPALIRSLSTQQVRVENLGEQYSSVPTASISPAPIPLRVKVALVCPPQLYRLLFQLDEEFRELFKVRIDFTPEVAWTAAAVDAYAGFIARCVSDGGLRHFDAAAVARAVEETARWRDSQRKLSTHLRDLDDLVTEASYWAVQNGHEVVLGDDVERAVREKARRSSLAEERLREMITDGTIRVEVSGTRPGQLNGLAVVEHGDHRFGLPSRISATAALGRGTLESIERETKLGGPLHNKGFLIVSGYLASMYAQRWPLAVRATLTFEQSYDEIEGDSASSGELYALLSALSGVPLKQAIAVTGSVDQHGNVQAIGGVNDKIEGFFKVCKVKGLTGDQGVLIPTANLADLMLDGEVVEAVEAGRFHVWAVDHVDQGIEVLTAVPAGERQADGDYPEGTVHRRVAETLRGYANLQALFGAHQNGDAAVATRQVVGT